MKALPPLLEPIAKLIIAGERLRRDDTHAIPMRMPAKRSARQALTERLTRDGDMLDAETDPVSDGLPVRNE